MKEVKRNSIIKNPFFFLNSANVALFCFPLYLLKLFAVSIKKLCYRANVKMAVFKLIRPSFLKNGRI
ncbi:hypothetical protein DB41_GU00200 [Neochlamydia sp. TUME1]|nr:hypothetical protein DB41_GU00200 [Neochlamydia sp. TUME1]